MYARLFLLASALPLTLAFASLTQANAQAAVTGKNCKPIAPQMALSKEHPFLRNLNEPARFDLHQAVVQSLDGCPVPAILRRDVDESRSRDVPRDRGSVRLLTR